LTEPSAIQHAWLVAYIGGVRHVATLPLLLQSVHAQLQRARFAVEDPHGRFRSTEPFSTATTGLDSEHVELEALLHRAATRVVVASPDQDMEEFLAVVENIGLHRVSYAVGGTAWLDIAPHGQRSHRSGTRRWPRTGLGHAARNTI
jgi:hypothetical protein